MDTIIEARSMDKIPSERGETQAQNPRGHRCKEVFFFFFFRGGREWGHGKQHKRKKNLGQEENKQTEVLQRSRKENS